MRKKIQWIAFFLAILATIGLTIFMINGVHMSREEMYSILIPFYGLSLLMIIISNLFPKKG